MRVGLARWSSRGLISEVSESSTSSDWLFAFFSLLSSGSSFSCSPLLGSSGCVGCCLLLVGFLFVLRSLLASCRGWVAGSCLGGCWVRHCLRWVLGVASPVGFGATAVWVGVGGRWLLFFLRCGVVVLIFFAGGGVEGKLRMATFCVAARSTVRRLTHPDGGIVGPKSLCRPSTGHRPLSAAGRRRPVFVCGWVPWAW